MKIRHIYLIPIFMFLSSCGILLPPELYVNRNIHSQVISYVSTGTNVNIDSLGLLSEHKVVDSIIYRRNRPVEKINVFKGERCIQPYNISYRYNIFGGIKELKYFLNDSLIYRAKCKHTTKNEILMRTYSIEGQQINASTFFIVNDEGVIIERQYKCWDGTCKYKRYLDSLEHPIKEEYYKKDSLAWRLKSTSRTISKEIDSLGNWTKIYNVTDHRSTKSFIKTWRHINYSK